MKQKQSIPLSSVRNARELGGYKTFDGGAYVIVYEKPYYKEFQEKLISFLNK